MANISIKLTKTMETEADVYVNAGLYDSREELVSEALRYYFRTALKANVDAAVKMYGSGEVSLGRAAEIAGVSYEDMRQILKGRGIGIKIGPESVDEAEEELSKV